VNAPELTSLLALVAPHAWALALCSARLVPIAFLSPILGGQAAPATVRLGLVLALAFGLHFAGGVGEAVRLGGVAAAAGVVREAVFGTAIGLVAALPFDAARIGGRLVDLFRGTSAEAALPVTGTRESATGDALYQLLVALAVTGGAAAQLLGAVWRSFGLVRLGAFVPTESMALQISGLAGTALAVGLAVGAPVAGLSLLVDAFLGLASRAAPQLHLQELGAPLRILGGGAALWLGIGLAADRLLAGIGTSTDWLARLAEVAR